MGRWTAFGVATLGALAARSYASAMPVAASEEAHRSVAAAAVDPS